MPGKQVKDWASYHKYRRQGMSKTNAAITANYKAKLRRQGRLKKKK